MNTYYIKSQTSNITSINLLDNLLLLRGNWEEYNPDKHKTKPTFLYVDDDYIVTMPELFSVKAHIKNIIDDNKQSISVKDKLYINYHNLNPKSCEKYMMKQYQFNIENYKNVPKDIFSKIQIIKPVRGFKGTYNKVIQSYNEFIAYIENIKLSNLPKYIKTNNFVIAEYIKNPLLLNGFKFHIRIYYVYFNEKGYLFRYGNIVTAKKIYKNTEFNDKSIHDTHGVSVSLILFPDDLIKIIPDMSSIFEQLIEIFQNITKLLKPSCYNEADICYHIFGADIMITDDFKVKLLEINNKPTMRGIPNNNRHIDFFTNYFEGMLYNVIDKIIPPKNKQMPNDYYIEV